MKTHSLLFALILGMAASSSAQTFNPVRKFVVDSKDAYNMKMTMLSTMGEIKIDMDMTQTVKKVYDNGDADIETDVTNMTVSLAGNTMPSRKQPPSTMRLNKYGMPVSNSTGRNQGMNFSRFGNYFGDKELKVGDVYSFDQPDKDNPKNHAKGTAKLVSIVDGKAKLEVSVDNWFDGVAKPMHLDGTAIADAASSKMLRFEGKATDLPGLGGGGQGPAVSSATFVIEHK